MPIWDHSSLAGPNTPEHEVRPGGLTRSFDPDDEPLDQSKSAALARGSTIRRTYSLL